jgi:hypothetical protein
MNSPCSAPLAHRSALSFSIATLLAGTAQAALAAPIVWNVTTCGDGPESTTLRASIAAAASGDIIELGTAPCSVISLATGGTSLHVLQNDLTIRNSSGRSITVNGSALPSGYNPSRVFYTVPSGTTTLTIDHVNVTGGHVSWPNIPPVGGCIMGNNLVLIGSTVSGCSAQAPGGGASGSSEEAEGGAIFAVGDVTLIDSAVLDSAAVSFTYYAIGGGVYSQGHVQAIRSVISNNVAKSGESPVATCANNIFIHAYGGGISARSGITMSYSTVSGNAAYAYGCQVHGGGLTSGGDVTISYSTIRDNAAISTGTYGSGGGIYGKTNVSLKKTTVSGNFASLNGGGIDAYSAKAPLSNTNTFTMTASTISGNFGRQGGGVVTDSAATKIYNSTIAFNTANLDAAHGAPYGAGLTLYTAFTPMTATLSSNLIAQNYAGSSERDLGGGGVDAITFSAATAKNLIRVSNLQTGLLPNDTKQDCPLLGLLRDNGGLTQTIALLSHSPAIDAGANVLSLIQDQRGSDLAPYPYPRVSHGTADIGAYEVNQADVVFNSAFDGCAAL